MPVEQKGSSSMHSRTLPTSGLSLASWRSRKFTKHTSVPRAVNSSFHRTSTTRLWSSSPGLVPVVLSCTFSIYGQAKCKTRECGLLDNRKPSHKVIADHRFLFLSPEAAFFKLRTQYDTASISREHGIHHIISVTNWPWSLWSQDLLQRGLPSRTTVAMCSNGAAGSSP